MGKLTKSIKAAVANVTEKNEAINHEMEKKLMMFQLKLQQLEAQGIMPKQ
ncbi:hypothetical protein [Floridanema evergladense]|uniref:Uncharacterized protein n=1 Tax=Floridaenema evergladense BLCC-F167 TaxID=3153639 RepID=A0ABV4WD03_9CYAN